MLIESSRSPAALLAGQVIHSEAQAGVRYELERLIGHGGMGKAYLARREGPSGTTPVVVKIVRTGFAEKELSPELVALKEAVALGRLNERVPPTPYVVRFVDAGSTLLVGPWPTPWTAIEYVHGGVEGTTLEDRVTYSLHKTGYAFDSRRAAHAIRCLAAGLSEIHSVSVLHRDLTPGNVLCCGFGETEIFKIADFGGARTLGIDRTFVGLQVGTIGYAAPEASGPNAGPHSDVFSLAAVVYYLLTGQRYFDVESPYDALKVVTSSARPSISDHASLAPDLLEREQVVSAIDSTLARATSHSPAHRPQSASEFAAHLLAALREPTAAPQSHQRLLSAVLSSARPKTDPDYRWTVRHHPREDLVITSVAWDADGHALTLSPTGAWFWNGETFLDASSLVATSPFETRFVERHVGGGFLLGGDSPRLTVVGASGVTAMLAAPHSDATFSLASGNIDDLLSAVEAPVGRAPVLWCASRRRWLKPFPLAGVARVTALRRLDSSRWVVAGRLTNGSGFAAIYSPLHWHLEPLAVPKLRAFIGGASVPERSSALLVGSEGVCLSIDGEAATSSLVPGRPELAAAALDVLGGEWAATLGTLFGRDGVDQPWRPFWSDPSWRAPFVSVTAEPGLVTAMTADGGIVEGRAVTSGVRTSNSGPGSAP